MNAHSLNPHRSPMDYIVDSGCCAYRQWEECSLPLITSACQQKGQEVLHTVMSKLLGGVPDFICSKKLFMPNSKICTELPTIESQNGKVNWTYAEQHKFSFFGLLKLFLIRDASA